MDDEHLGFVFKAPKSGRVKDAIPITLESCPVFWFILWDCATF
jgi:hypothetical protein